MKCLRDGHVYELDVINEGKEPVAAQYVSFMERQGGVMVAQGTTNEEVLEMMILRMRYLQKKLSCRENAIVITKLEEALMWLQRRTMMRVAQGIETTDVAHDSESLKDIIV